MVVLDEERHPGKLVFGRERIIKGLRPLLDPVPPPVVPPCLGFFTTVSTDRTPGGDALANPTVATAVA